MTEKSRNWQQKALNIVLKQNNFLRKGKMYGQLKRPPMEEWSKQRHVDHVALIYFQKMLQVLTSHTSKLPKKVLKNTKNMTPKWGSVRSADFLPYRTWLISDITFNVQHTQHGRSGCQGGLQNKLNQVITANFASSWIFSFRKVSRKKT